MEAESRDTTHVPHFIRIAYVYFQKAVSIVFGSNTAVDQDNRQTHPIFCHWLCPSHAAEPKVHQSRGRHVLSLIWEHTANSNIYVTKHVHASQKQRGSMCTSVKSSWQSLQWSHPFMPQSVVWASVPPIMQHLLSGSSQAYASLYDYTHNATALARLFTRWCISIQLQCQHQQELTPGLQSRYCKKEMRSSWNAKPRRLLSRCNNCSCDDVWILLKAPCRRLSCA